MTILQTERLTLQAMTLDDMSDMFAIYSDEAAMQFIPYLPHQSLEETRAHFEPKLCGDGSQWTIRLKGQDTVIGALNIFHDARVPGMGYILHPDYWGQGITVEACRALIDYCFDNLGFDRLELWIDEKNAASSRVAQKLGFTARGRLAHKYQHRAHYHFMTVWGVLKSEWRSDSQHSESMETQFYNVDPVLHVRDTLATVAFYRDKLGFTVDFLYGDPTYYAIVSRGEWSANMVSIHLSQVAAEQAIVSSCNLHIHIGETLDTLCEQYRSAGVQIVEAPDNKPWGLREFTIEDLNGHRLVFAGYF